MFTFRERGSNLQIKKKIIIYCVPGRAGCIGISAKDLVNSFYLVKSKPAGFLLCGGR